MNKIVKMSYSIEGIYRWHTQQSDRVECVWDQCHAGGQYAGVRCKTNSQVTSSLFKSKHEVLIYA